jgi:broad-specificity NMP kinase
MKILVGIAGKTSSGKTKLAHGLAQRLNADVLSFGEYVRGLSLSGNLQNFGQELVNRNVIHFVNGFLEPARKLSSPILVVEGVRHVEVWKMLQERYANNILVVLCPEQATLVDRLVKRGFTPEGAVSRLEHPVESELDLLKEMSDLILIHEEPQEAVNIVQACLKGHNWS